MYVKTLKTINTKVLRFKHTWVKPSEGYDTQIQIYNSATSSKVPFIVKDRNYVSWYTCGPTVYDTSHIGHGSCYVKVDIIHRILRDYFKLNVVTVLNITDIDDKIIKRANETKSSALEISEKYTTEFLKDLNDLKVKKPDRVVKVTENIELIKAFIEKLVDEKKAYIASTGSVYFDVKAHGDLYGKLVNLGENADFGNKGIKKNAADFALWKAAKEGEPAWESKYSLGRPGWHIECSALAAKFFGSSIDVHAGGMDLKFPHHENEEAQSCAYFSKPQWVNYWLHTGQLALADGVKMSKSLKNTISIQDMLSTVHPDVFRMACLMSHYRYQMEYSEDLIQTADSYLKSFKNFILDCNAYQLQDVKPCLNSDVLLAALNECVHDIDTSLKNDFSTAEALKSLFKMMSTTNKMLHSAADQHSEDHSMVIIAIQKCVINFLSMCGFTLTEDALGDTAMLNSVINLLIESRHKFRMYGIETKNAEILRLCDNLREDIKNQGIILKDTGKMSVWTK